MTRKNTNPGIKKDTRIVLLSCAFYVIAVCMILAAIACASEFCI